MAPGCSAPPLTAAARSAERNVGRDQETALSRTKKLSQARTVSSVANHKSMRICWVNFHQKKWVRSRKRRRWPPSPAPSHPLSTRRCVVCCDLSPGSRAVPRLQRGRKHHLIRHMRSLVSDLSDHNATPAARAFRWALPWSRRGYPGFHRGLTEIISYRITPSAMQHWRTGRRPDAIRLRQLRPIRSACHVQSRPRLARWTGGARRWQHRRGDQHNPRGIDAELWLWLRALRPVYRDPPDGGVRLAAALPELWRLGHPCLAQSGHRCWRA